MSTPIQAEQDSVVTRSLWAVIALLVSLCGWLFRQARRVPLYANGQKFSRQEYIQNMEALLERNKKIMLDIPERMTTMEELIRRQVESSERHQIRIDSLEDDLTKEAQSVKDMRQDRHRLNGDLRLIQDSLKRLESRFPA